VRTSIRFLAVLTLVVVLAASGHANPVVPPDLPKPKKESPTTSVVIVANDQVKEARLQIPRKLVKDLQVGGLFPEGGDARTENRLPALNTLVAGLTLSLALTLGGLWLVRQRRRTPGRGATALLLAAAVLLGASGALVWANVPPRERPPQPANPTGMPLPGKVAIEIVDKGDAITLIVNRGELAKIVDKAAEPKPGEAPKK
jgi:hypothetical protein